MLFLLCIMGIALSIHINNHGNFVDEPRAALFFIRMKQSEYSMTIMQTSYQLHISSQLIISAL
ncbi:unnamed protein product [Paramecium octaurelia]|uniref:Uncharacterized protein n=1 Tax=Paramecium octaurelia TaxID=43137 RepID=A0A8S1X1G5_PAROT|nr:unnamed protein product [Paramecium octaurelia]